MARYIDAEILLEALDTYDKFACLPNGKLEPFRNLQNDDNYVPYVKFDDVMNTINNAPTEDVKPIVRGEWICVCGSSAICNKCNRLNQMYGDFCKYCGADMRKE